MAGFSGALYLEVKSGIVNGIEAVIALIIALSSHGILVAEYNWCRIVCHQPLASQPHIEGQKSKHVKLLQLVMVMQVQWLSQ